MEIEIILKMICSESLRIFQQETIFTVNLGEPDELKKKEVINAGCDAGAYCCI